MNIAISDNSSEKFPDDLIKAWQQCNTLEQGWSTAAQYMESSAETVKKTFARKGIRNDASFKKFIEDISRMEK